MELIKQQYLINHQKKFKINKLLNKLPENFRKTEEPINPIDLFDKSGKK